MTTHNVTACVTVVTDAKASAMVRNITTTVHRSAAPAGLKIPRSNFLLAGSEHTNVHAAITGLEMKSKISHI